jgi:hypothetical protein
MLESLREVPWGALRDAYGPANEVPGFLERLLSVDPEKRRTALEELWSRLCHQSTIASASSAAVPHLMAVAERAPPAVACEVLILVGSMASATLRFSERGDGYVPLSPGDNPVRTTLAENRRQLLELLEHPQREIRLAAQPPAACVEPTRDVVTRVRRILRTEEDSRSQAAAALVLLLLGERSHHMAGLIRQVMSDVNSAVDQRDFLHDLAAGKLPEERISDAVDYLIDFVGPVVVSD